MDDDFRADLHCHTTCSDGSLSPIQVVNLAKQTGLQGLSITDHDTIDAYAEAIPAAKEAGIELISGVEFSAMHDNASVHILGYAYDLKSPAIQTFCQQHHQRRKFRNEAILVLLGNLGMPITEDDVSEYSLKDGTIGRPHIAQAMLKKGYVDSIQDAFKRFIGEGKPAYAKGNNFSVEETIGVIHQAKGLAIIAHPHLIKDSKIVQQLLTMNFDGLEGYYGRFPSEQHKKWLKAAKKRDWIVTGGSDFHGEIRPNSPLGSSWVREETFRLLQTHFENANR
jgi:3',5'-nucleoside bisphosphate phosphatase